MRLNTGIKVCVWAIVGLSAAGPAWGQSQYGDGSIVGWGAQVVGVDLTTDLVAVAAGQNHRLGIKGYPGPPGALDIKPGSCPPTRQPAGQRLCRI